MSHIHGQSETKQKLKTQQSQPETGSGVCVLTNQGRLGSGRLTLKRQEYPRQRANAWLHFWSIKACKAMLGASQNKITSLKIEHHVSPFTAQWI